MTEQCGIKACKQPAHFSKGTKYWLCGSHLKMHKLGPWKVTYIPSDDDVVKPRKPPTPTRLDPPELPYTRGSSNWKPSSMVRDDSKAENTIKPKLIDIPPEHVALLKGLLDETIPFTTDAFREDGRGRSNPKYIDKMREEHAEQVKALADKFNHNAKF